MVIFHSLPFICSGRFASNRVLAVQIDPFISPSSTKSQESRQIGLFDHPSSKAEEHLPIFLAVPQPFSSQLIFSLSLQLLISSIPLIFSVLLLTMLASQQPPSDPLLAQQQVLAWLQALDQTVAVPRQQPLELPLLVALPSATILLFTRLLSLLRSLHSFSCLPLLRDSTLLPA